MMAYYQFVKNKLRILLGGDPIDEVAEADKRLLEQKNAPWKGVDALREETFVEIGRYTYGLSPSSVFRATKEAPVRIGSFCSFAPGVIILANADHPLSFPSTYPFRTLFCNKRSETFNPSWPNYDAVTKGGVYIGHDVWVGQNAIILSGVTIGNGAVVGAGAVVAKDVPPYAIVVGNPARIVRFRFCSEVIEGLEKTEWWCLSDDEIDALLPLFYSAPEELIASLLNRKNK
jgi:acetyltransferase-like isoleucine patch superfamily enzyme